MAKRADAVSGRRVAVVVDHPVRDLAGAVLVAQELCQRGAVCHLVPMNFQESEVWALRPDFVLLNFLRQGSNDEFARRLVRAGIRFGLLDTEGGVWPSESSYAEILWKDRALLHETRCACMWGPRLAEYLVATGLLPAPRVHVTGCARFDTYHPRWKGLLADAALPNGPRRILVNTNYYTANGRFVTADENRRQLEEMGWSPSRAREAVDAETAALAAMIDLARLLSTRLPETTIVVRPHPFENPACYREALAGLANVEINDAGPVQTQLARASLVVQRGCTTAIEATLASVPAVSPRWIPAANENPMAEDVSVPCETPEVLLETAREVLGGGYAPPVALAEKRREVIRDWFFEIDGKAHVRVCDAVDECLREPSAIDAALCRRFLYRPEDIGRPAVGSRVRHALHLSPHWSFRLMRRFVPGPRPEKALVATEVEELARRITDLRIRAGEHVRPVSVAPTRASGEYRNGFRGHAVTLRVAA